MQRIRIIGLALVFATIPAFLSAQDPVEGVRLGLMYQAEYQPARGAAVALSGDRQAHRRFPTTVASGYIRRCSSPWTSIAARKGRQSRAVSVALSIRS